MRGAVDVVQGSQQAADLVIGDAVEDRLRLPPRRHQSFAPELREMLRQSRLAQIRRIGQGRDRQLSGQRETAKDKKPLVIADGPQDAGDLTGFSLQHIDPVRDLHASATCLSYC